MSFLRRPVAGNILLSPINGATAYSMDSEEPECFMESSEQVQDQHVQHYDRARQQNCTR